MPIFLAHSILVDSACMVELLVSGMSSHCFVFVTFIAVVVVKLKLRQEDIS